MSVINTNMKSLITQNNLTVNNRALSSAMEKLSTGKRINTAGDDAAGLAISNKMTAQIRGLNQSVRNANDGISMIQTAEGALTEVTNMLQRMRELAVQSANDTNTSSDRFALDLEYQQLGREISRIATNTQWNAMNILNNTEVGVAGSASDVGEGVRNVKFQVGANPNQVINIGLKDFSYGVAVGTTASETSFTIGDNVSMSGKQHFAFTIGSQNFAFSTTRALHTGTSAEITAGYYQMTEEELVDFETQMNKSITDTEGFANVAVTRVGNTIYVRDAEGRSISDGADSAVNALQYFTDPEERTSWVNGAIDGSTAIPGRASSITGGGGDLNGVEVAAGSVAGAVSSESQFDLTSVDAATSVGWRLSIGGANFDISLANNAALSTTSTTSMDAFVDALKAKLDATAGYENVDVVRQGTKLYVKDSAGRDIGSLTAYTHITTRTAAAETATAVELSIGMPPPASTAVFSGSARLNDTQIKTQSGANQAIARLDNAMANVDHELATFGSVMNRLTFAGDNLTNVSQNTQQSRSRVLDTDYAASTTELARTQIIQQAGMAMLAQANQQPQTVLSLLQ